MGCSANPPGTTPNPDWDAEPQVPGLVAIPGVRELVLQQGRHDLEEIAAYVPDSGGTPRVLFAIGPVTSTYDTLYELGVDGSGLRTLRLSAQCAGPFARSGDGRWVACPGVSGILLFPLHDGVPGPARLALPTPAGGRYWDVAWSPDGTSLAAMTYGLGGCGLALYDLASVGGELRARPPAA
jgi:hypothetical protein